MERIRVSNLYRTFLALIVIVLFTSPIIVFPSKTLALEESTVTRTQQLLPIGGNSCAPLSVTSFTPYIYDGALHSFEFTVPDASYVALFGSVGNTSLSFNQLSRRIDASGSLRVHADIETTPIVGTLSLQITLLSARDGQPVCLATISMSVGSGPVQVSSTIPVIPISTVPVVVPATTPDESVGGGVSLSTSSEPSGSMATTSATSVAPVVNTVQDTLNGFCASEASAYRLWLILLVVFALVVGLALWAEFPMSVSWARTPERIATLILILLVLLLGFWYFSPACRAALWMPLVAFLIAILGLLAAFWNHPRVTHLLLSQESKK